MGRVSSDTEPKALYAFKLKRLKDFAKKKKGKCLSNEYISVEEKVEWECNKGHRWFAAPKYVLRGTWCRLCAIEGYSGSIEEMQKLAKKKGGECLSKEYINCKTKLNWKCKRGHKFEATPSQAKTKVGWCKKCQRIEKMEEIKKKLSKHKIKCINDEYVSYRYKYTLENSEGHRWEADLNQIGKIAR